MSQPHNDEVLQSLIWATLRRVPYGGGEMSPWDHIQENYPPDEQADALKSIFCLSLEQALMPGHFKVILTDLFNQMDWNGVVEGSRAFMAGDEGRELELEVAGD